MPYGRGDGGKVIFCFHGWPNSKQVWSPLGEFFSDHILWCPDAPGSGHADEIAAYSCNGVTEKLLEWTGAVQEDEVSWFLMGHSMGGKLAQLAAARQPRGLAGLILICPAPLVAFPVAESQKERQRAMYGNRRDLETLFAGMTPNALTPENQKMLIDDGLACSRSAFNGWIEVMREEDFRDELAKITVPTLVLHGEKDPLRTEAGLRETVVEPIAGAQFDILPGVGHLPHLEDPAMLAARVQAFLHTIEETGT